MKPSITSGRFNGTIPIKYQPANAFTLLEQFVVLGTLAVLALADAKTDAACIGRSGRGFGLPPLLCSSIISCVTSDSAAKPALGGTRL